MIDNLRPLVSMHFGVPEEELFFTKFCQRIVRPNTKILFLVTYKGRRLCIVKTVRYPEFNERLRREKRAQTMVSLVGKVRAAKVFFEGEVMGRYLYAEECVMGAMLSRRNFRRRQKDIRHFSEQLPQRGTIYKKELQTLLRPFFPDISVDKEEYALALTHGDLGRPNILETRDGTLVVIDWERAGDIPVLDDKIQDAYQSLYKKQPERYRELVERFHFDV